MHPKPELTDRSIVATQMNGHPLPHQEEPKVEYHLKTNAGRLAATFNDLELVQPFLDQREQKHGAKVAPLTLFRVTTISEKL